MGGKGSGRRPKQPRDQCEDCGKDLKLGHKLNICRKCWSARLYEKQKRICPVCYQEFSRRPTQRDKAICCSQKCGNIWQGERRRIKTTCFGTPPRPCVDCGLMLFRNRVRCDWCYRVQYYSLSPSGTWIKPKRRFTLVDVCACGRYKRDYAKKCRVCNNKGRDHAMLRRRCRKNGVAYSYRITLNRVGEAFDWRCVCCHRKVKRHMTHKHRATMDHVIPLSAKVKGHEVGNVVLLCAACNESKVDTRNELREAKWSKLSYQRLAHLTPPMGVTISGEG